MKFMTTIAIAVSLSMFAANGICKGNDPKLPQSQPTDEPNNPQPQQGDRIIDRTLIDKKSAVEESTPTTSAAEWTWAVGTNLSWSFRKDYGSRNFRRFEPEVVGFLYTSTPIENVWLRHGARLSYSNAQPQMPKAVRIEEYDWKASIEEGIVWSSIVAPSLTAGIGRDWRTIKVKAKPPITSVDSRLNTKDEFMWMYLQAGLGIPVAHGKYLIEPVVRYQHLAHDDRTNLAAGIEMTVAW
jgi:hypothetical protein